MAEDCRAGPQCGHIDFGDFLEKLEIVDSWVHEAGKQESNSVWLEQCEVVEQFLERATEGNTARK